MKRLIFWLLFAAPLCASSSPNDSQASSDHSRGFSWTVPRYGWGGLFAASGATGVVLTHKKMKYHAQELQKVCEQLKKDPDNQGLKALEKRHRSKKNMYKTLFVVSVLGATGGGLAIGDTFRRATFMPWREKPTIEKGGTFVPAPGATTGQWNIRQFKEMAPYTHNNLIRQGIQNERGRLQQLFNPWINWNRDNPNVKNSYVSPYLQSRSPKNLRD